MSVGTKSVYDNLYATDGLYNYCPEDKITFILTQLSTISKTSTILDVGCGKGHYSRALINSGYTRVYGVEQSSICSNNYLQDIPHTCADFVDWAETDNKLLWDMVLCMDVVEHIPPEFIDNFMLKLSKVSNTAYIGIANHSDILNGVELHLIREDSSWWNNKLLEFYKSAELLDNNSERFFIFRCKN